MSKKLFISTIIFGVILIAYGAYIDFRLSQIAQALETNQFIEYTGDVIGTKNGTTTTAEGFYGNHTGSSSYISKIGSANTAVYAFWVKNASSSADIRFSILASNDDFCETATTSSGVGYDVVTMSQIKWFDAAPFLDMHAAQSLTNGTSTFNWNTSDGAGSGRTLLLTKLVAQCLRLDVNASSTELRAEIRGR
jgi:hypothetical protein